MKKLYVLILMLISLSSCAFPASKQGMVVTDLVSNGKIGEKIFVSESTGGSVTLPFWTSQISNTNFTAAVKDSLLNSKVFTGLSSDWGKEWGLKIKILDVNQPFIGADFTVTTKIQYSLYLRNKKIFETVIQEDGTATMDDAVVGVKRLRLANEYSAKANIQKFIEELLKKRNSFGM